MEKMNDLLLEAAKKGDLTQIKNLLKQGADIEALDKDFKTPLMWSASNGHLDCVKYLVRKDAYIDCNDKHGNTPFSLSNDNFQWHCTAYLMKAMDEYETKIKKENKKYGKELYT